MDTRISSWCSASGPCPDGNSPVGSEVINSEWGSRTSMSTMRAETLDNGLLILLAEQRTVPVATFWVWYRVGSRNEMPGLTGISHWVEHMLFKGTPTHPKGMLTRHIDRLGGRWNAFTWKDYTAYHEVLPADHLGVAITLEADRMINTVMEPAEVESERTVIISEREPQQEGERRVVLRRPGGATAYLHIAFHVPSASHQDLAALLVADGLLSGFKSFVPFDQGGGGRSSRLYRALVDSGLASDAGTALTPGADPTLFRVTVTARAGVDPAAVERRKLEEVERLARQAAGPLEREKVKKQAKAQDVFSRDGGVRRAMGPGGVTIVDGPEAFASLLTRIDRVTLDDVLRVADTYFTEKNRTVGWYLPEGGATTAGARAAVRPEVFFWSPLRAQLQVPPITPRTVARTELRNGMVVLVKETPGTGLVAVHGYIKAGAMYDGTRSGLARYVAAMLQRGTRRDSSQELAEHLDGLGASLVIRADMEAAGIGLGALAEDGV